MSFLLPINVEFKMFNGSFERVLQAVCRKKTWVARETSTKGTATCNPFGDIANLQRLSGDYRLDRLQLKDHVN
jgi:hypothetical protein